MLILFLKPSIASTTILIFLIRKFQVTSEMRHNGCIKASKRAKPEQLRGVKLPERGDDQLPAAGRETAADEAHRHGLQRGFTAAFRR